MCRFLSIVLRVWTHIRIKVIESLEKSGEVLRNIYKGVPTKKTKAPTGKIILDVFEDLILCWIDSDKCQVNAISPLARELLRHLGVSEYIYEDLANSCKKIY